MPDIELTEGDDDYRQPLEDRYTYTRLFGRRGNDRLAIYNGEVHGGPGADTLQVLSTPNEPWLRAAIDYRDDPSGVRVDLAQQTAVDGWGNTDQLMGVNHVNGSIHDDLIIGNSQDNFFNTNWGRDTVIGGDGFDVLNFPGWQPEPGQPWVPTLLRDLVVDVAPDAGSARITHRGTP